MGDSKINSSSRFISSKQPDKYLIFFLQSGFSFKISKMSQDLHLLHDFDVLIAVICILVRNKTYINGYISINYVCQTFSPLPTFHFSFDPEFNNLFWTR